MLRVDIDSKVSQDDRNYTVIRITKINDLDEL